MEVRNRVSRIERSVLCACGWSARSCRAVTLVEVVVGIVLAGVVALGAAGFFYHSISLIDNSRTKRIALELVSSRLDDALASTYDSVLPSTESGVTVGNWTGTALTQVTEYSEGSAHYKVVQVTIKWQKAGNTYQVALSTIVGEK